MLAFQIAMKSEILERFANLARDRADETAFTLRSDGVRWSFTEVAERAARLAPGLPAEAGVPVAVAAGNHPDFVALFLACIERGIPFVSLDGDPSLDEKLALCAGLRIPLLLDRDEGGEEVGRGLWAHRPPVDRPVEVPRGTVLVKLTSGSTGKTKGACFDEGALKAGFQQIMSGMGIEPRDRVLIAVPLSHSYAFDNGVLSLVLAGTPLIVEQSLLPARLIATIIEEGVSELPLVPPLVYALAETEWPTGSAPRLVISAGGPLTPGIAERFLARTGSAVHQFYGATECGGISFERSPTDPEAVGTVGSPLPGVRVELGEGGIVRVHSSANFQARFGEDSHGGAKVVEPGDTGEWTPEGRLRLTGRSADILNIGGKKVAAVVIERALLALEGVEQAAVVGVEDAVRGDRVVAFVVARQPPDVSAMPAGLTPREVRRIDSLPFTKRGKLDRLRLRSLAASSPRREGK